MGFLSGPLAFERYVVSDGPQRFDDEHIQALAEFAIGNVESADEDQPDIGFIAGQHLFDTDFKLEKNIVNDALLASIRIDTNKVPASLRQAWLKMELAALAADNPSGRPTKAQRQQAKETVDARCVDELKSGKYRKMKQYSFMWDARDSVLYLGATSETVSELTNDLLNQAFGISLERVSSGTLAEAWARKLAKPRRCRN